MKIIETRLCTIDGSTVKTSITLFINGSYKDHTLLDYSKDKNTESRFSSMSNGIWDFLNVYNPNIVYIEETYMGTNAQTLKILTRLQGVVYAWCMIHNCEFNTITASNWRKQLSIQQKKGTKRKELKEQAIQYVLDNYEMLVTDDEADSICIGDAVIKMFIAKEK